MRGSVAKKNDRWYVVIEDRDPATGARRRRWHSGFRTKREAQAACNELATAMQRGDYLQANRQTVGELALERLATIAPTVRPHRPIKAWTAETLRTFLAATGDDELSALWIVLATTGLRRGEALGLRWSDVDMEAGRATITQTATVIGWNIHLGQPKTQAGRRPIALDVSTIKELREHRRVAPSRTCRGGIGADLVFSTADGGPLHPERVYQAFRRAVIRHRLPPIPVHGLRHTWATLA